MPASFARTLRFLETDHAGRRGVEFLVAALLVAGAAWFFLAEIKVYEVTDKARLETAMGAHPIAARVGGKVKETHLALGPVNRGDVLVELDTEMEQRAIQQKRLREQVLADRLKALDREMRAEQDRTGVDSERRARLAKLEREATELVGEVALEKAALAMLAEEIERHTIRAPVSGRVEEIVPECRVGAVVRTAEKLGSIVPDANPLENPLRAVALFPAAAVGRIKKEHKARLRLDGFPWTQYGTIPARVAAVAHEPSDGLIRVELTLDPNPPPFARHGLPGSAEVEVEAVSPAVLLLRAAGQLLRVKGEGGSGVEKRTTP